jgi:protein phosphatase PTC7
MQRALSVLERSYLKTRFVTSTLSTRRFFQQKRTYASYTVEYNAQYRGKQPTKTPVPGRPDCGEDAFFQYVSTDQKSKFIGAFGVADGVGGYADMGVDPALMAWQVVDNTKKYFEQNANDAERYQDPRAMLALAYKELIAEKQVAAGGTTACICSIFQQDEKLFLQFANLGDSAFAIIRQGQIVFRTTDQTHQWNMPYQLNVPIPEVPELDGPQHADSFLEPFALEENDIIVMGTDGLWDNMFDARVNEIVKKHDNLENAAKEILWETIVIAENRRGLMKTPFQVYSAKYGINFPGGKLDDITVLVVQVKGNEPR